MLTTLRPFVPHSGEAGDPGTGRTSPASHVRTWWRARGQRVLGVATVVLGLLALLKLGSELHRLTISDGRYAAIDLLLRYEEVQRWFAGLPVYGELVRLTQPPQAHLFLWPFMGWLDPGPARFLWAVTSALALAWLATLAIRESGASTRHERLFVLIMLLSMNAVGVAIGNGQVILHLLPAMIAAVLLLNRPLRTWRTDIGIAVLLNIALVKPTLSAPFVWLLLFARRPLMPVALTAGLWLLLNLAAASFQDASLPALIAGWLDQPHILTSRGYGNLHGALHALGLADWLLPGSLLLLLAAGIWMYRHRHADPWILMGVSAIVARLWSYHRVYDDVLIFLPMLALFRIAQQGPAADDGDVYAGLLLAGAILAMIAPARLAEATPPLELLFSSGHVLLWLVMLFLLMWRARAADVEFQRAT